VWDQPSHVLCRFGFAPFPIEDHGDQRRCRRAADAGLAVEEYRLVGVSGSQELDQCRDVRVFWDCQTRYRMDDVVDQETKMAIT
jgi:hypothetical protein